MTQTQTPTAMTFHSASDAEAARLLADDGWVAEPKLDGVRCLCLVEAGRASLLNRHGKPLSASSTNATRPAVKAALEAALAEGRWVLDGELMEDGTLWLFDLVEAPINFGRDYESRRLVLDKLAELVGWSAGVIRITPIAHGTAAKRQLLDDVRASGGEGIMLKQLSAGYVGKRSRAGLKVKLTSTVDCVIVARNTNGHTNAELGVHRGDGALIHIGAMSMIGKPDLPVGTIVEVECLYVGANMRLYQPRLSRVRTDKLAIECEWSQLPPLLTNKAVVEVAA